MAATAPPGPSVPLGPGERRNSILEEPDVMDKKGIAGVAVCILLLVAWYPLMKKAGWAPPARQPVPAAGPGETGPTERSPEADVAVDGPQDQEAPAPEAQAPPPRDQGAQPAPASEPATVAAPRPPPSDVTAPRSKTPPEHTVDVGDPAVFALTLDTVRGGITGVHLGHYVEDDRESPVTLGGFAFPLCSTETNSSDEAFALGSATIIEQDEHSIVLERQAGGGGVVLREQWALQPDRPYLIKYAVSLRNTGPESVHFPGLVVSCGGISLDRTRAAQGGGGRMAAFDLAVDVLAAGKRRSAALNTKKIEKLHARGGGGLVQQDTQWVAVHSKYFLMALARSDRSSFGSYRVGVTDGGEDGSGWLVADVLVGEQDLAPGVEAEQAFDCYAGPMELEHLGSMDLGLEAVLHLDRFLLWHPAWMGGLSKLVRGALLRLNRFFNHRWGYGWAIIVLTCIVKVLFWPLTHRSTVSMRKMQKLQPLIKEIREKHKSDPQKMNRKVMELYKEHKVSPLGGCLPMFAQIPVFFALFNTLRGSIELRHASFMWVADLSLPDTLPWHLVTLPIRPLAILMVVTMLLQQKMTPTSPDPSQARMMIMMTVFFAFIFYSMPAGLTLYWTVNQVLTIGQTLVTRRLTPDDSATGGAAVAASG